MHTHACTYEDTCLTQMQEALPLAENSSLLWIQNRCMRLQQQLLHVQEVVCCVSCSLCKSYVCVRMYTKGVFAGKSMCIMSICVCARIYIYIYIHTYIYRYMYIYIYGMVMLQKMCVCVCVWYYIYMYKYTHTHGSVMLQKMWVCECTYTYIHTCMHTYVRLQCYKRCSFAWRVCVCVSGFVCRMLNVAQEGHHIRVFDFCIECL
jgi:hypothetical protein